MVIGGIALFVVAYIAWHIAAPSATEDAAAAEHQKAELSHAVAAPAIYSVLPFVALLLSIAVFPLLHTVAHWWEHNRNKLLVAMVLGGVTVVYYALLYGHGVVDHATHQLSEVGWPTAVAVLKNSLLLEYIPFMTLLFSLYVVSGGIAVEGNLVGRPTLNTTIIGIGSVLASLIGTTGAAMLLIRPLLRANSRRAHVAHTVVMFIFVVCNTGGCLLPIGDPPLFLGYLRGVDFLWTLNLWPMWAFVNLSLLAIYFAWDSWRYKQEDRSRIEVVPESPQPFTIRGKINFLWLAAIILCVAILDPSKPVPGTTWHAPIYFREVVVLSITALSLWSTQPAVRSANSFNYGAILEVAALFVGIFVCMQAPIQILNVRGASLGIDTPAAFFWSTGTLSSFLDNAPTYVVFFETAKSIGGDGPMVAGVQQEFLIAISLGAVFMGAMTYIGNGPNFMVKAIAEANNVRMPSFFGYMVYSCGILLPLFVALTVIFLA